MCQMEGRDISKRMLFAVLFSCVSPSSSSKTCAEGLASVPKENPEFCVQPFEAKIAEDGTAVSKQGQTPDVSVSLFKARIACEKTLNDGKPMRVINYDQWVKAGGQYKYPWGNQFEDVCVLESRKAFGKWKHVQPSGSMEGCVSEHGVYDQLGNAWEWVDLGRTATRDEWVDYLARQGVDVEVNQSWIEIPAQVSHKLKFQAFCVMMEGLTIDEEGKLIANLREPISPSCTTRSKGYLWFDPLASKSGEGEPDRAPEPGSVLSAELWANRVVWDKVRDAEPLGAKVGGAYYSGGDTILRSLWLGHLPSFDGSIGFRCVSDPM